MPARVVGKLYPAVRFRLSRDEIRRFSRAVGENDPIHFERAAARGAGYADIVAPLTALTRVAVAAEALVDFDPDLALPRLALHGGQSIDSVRPVVAEELLVATHRIADLRSDVRWRYLTLETTFEDAGGAPVARWSSVLLYPRPRSWADPEDQDQ
jgi:acyl dehydratase